jgi:hypothetical protein
LRNKRKRIGKAYNFAPSVFQAFKSSIGLGLVALLFMILCQFAMVGCQFGCEAIVVVEEADSLGLGIERLGASRCKFNSETTGSISSSAELNRNVVAYKEKERLSLDRNEIPYGGVAPGRESFNNDDDVNDVFQESDVFLRNECIGYEICSDVGASLGVAAFGGG